MSKAEDEVNALLDAIDLEEERNGPGSTNVDGKTVNDDPITDTYEAAEVAPQSYFGEVIDNAYKEAARRDVSRRSIDERVQERLDRLGQEQEIRRSEEIYYASLYIHMFGGEVRSYQDDGKYKAGTHPYDVPGFEDIWKWFNVDSQYAPRRAQDTFVMDVLDSNNEMHSFQRSHIVRMEFHLREVHETPGF